MKTVDISGMGGGYENVCQRMLKNGREFLKKHGELKASLHGYANIYGVCDVKGEDAEALEKAVMEGIEDCTGAMHQAVMGHLFFIAKSGEEKWLGEFKDTPERIYEWDGTPASCPGVVA